ncbi:uncharacterized protein HaLaN_08479 [Haematococcus lacustris]|uniref:Uncharacterized protein n=1 Tax=Haematococcus lacustris TaxID=44745 RepID=A0A699Z0F9_HAELA|nr:uncharacterized protein HaLaN_08479 [Haematococcus lacustris]
MACGAPRGPVTVGTERVPLSCLLLPGQPGLSSVPAVALVRSAQLASGLLVPTTSLRSQLNTACRYHYPQCQVPLGAAGLYLLGRVYRLVGRLQDAKEQYVQALRLNPLMWSAYEELCALGGFPY